MAVTHTHRLILPADANHYGTLYAGSLLRLALEAAYAAAHRHIGPKANLVLRRVIDVECYYPVPIGSVVEIVGAAVHQTQAYLVIGLVGTPLASRTGPWMDGMMGFVQIDDKARPVGIPAEANDVELPSGDEWKKLKERLAQRLTAR